MAFGIVNSQGGPHCGGKGDNEKTQLVAKFEPLATWIQQLTWQSFCHSKRVPDAVRIAIPFQGPSMAGDALMANDAPANSSMKMDVAGDLFRAQLRREREPTRRKTRYQQVCH